MLSIECDLPVLTALIAWIAEGRRCAIATVIEAWGSAPRRPGALMVVTEDGLFEGSVSGGCVEGDVLVAAIDLMSRGGGFRRCDYGVADAVAWEVGLACGGKISIFIQTVGEAYFPLALCDRIIDACRSREQMVVTIDLATGRSMAGDVAGRDRLALRFRPSPRLLVVGAVHIAQALVPMARLAGFAPSIVDPRAMFAQQIRFGPDVTLDSRWPDEALADWRPDISSAVVTLTHDPKLDDQALRVALDSPCFYIGALGSRKTHAARLDRLRVIGYSEAELGRVNGPAGLPIAAANPGEIAVAILAQIIERWRKGA